LTLSSNPVNHLHSKHIRVRYHAIRDFIEHGDIKPNLYSYLGDGCRQPNKGNQG
jgi:hypothetical protein